MWLPTLSLSFKWCDCKPHTLGVLILSNDVIALDILVLDVQLVFQQLQLFQVVLIHLWLVPHQLQVEVRSKGDEDEDDGDEEASGDPSRYNVVPVRGIELHPAEGIELLRKRNTTMWLQCVGYNKT